MDANPQCQPDADKSTQTTSRARLSSIGDAVKAGKFSTLTQEETPEVTQEAFRRLAEKKENDVHQKKQTIFHSLMREVGARYRDCRMENYDIQTQAQKDVVNALDEYAADMPRNVQEGNGLLLYGSSGTGKDHLLIALARDAIRDHGTEFRWTNGMTMFGNFRDGIGEERSEVQTVRDYASPEVLILSDPLPPIGTLSQYQASMLMRILDERNREYRPTWATINVKGPAEAIERMGAPLVDRLRDGSVACECNWASFRKAQKTITSSPKE